ncbi:MAG: fused response regulator/phosphatase [Sedimentisphaerales bacterium]|nr:fused response regulator/phosphatase [Sedimentisphaerales bacterium]
MRPSDSPAADPTGRPDPTQGDSASSGSPRIFLIDDDRTAIALVKNILQKRNYQIASARSGREALERLRNTKPDLILLDCLMPDMEGFEVCRLIRQKKSFDDVPILFMTSLSEAGEKARGFAVGGTDYLIKPVDPLELLARIQTHLKLASIRSALRRQARELETLVKSQTQRLEQVHHGQQQLLVAPESVPEIQTAVRFQAAHEAGGDFYDILRLGEHQYGFLVADVSGHDLGTAYLTGALKALTVSFTNETLSVQETFFMLNNALNKFLETSQYATACYAKYHPLRQEVDLICAGHPSPLLQSMDGSVHPQDLIGDVLGMFGIVQCEQRTLPVQPGERLFLYTDGLIEPADASRTGPAGREEGIRLLSDALRISRSLPLKQAVDFVVDDLIQKNQGVVGDDIVLLGIEF